MTGAGVRRLLLMLLALAALPGLRPAWSQSAADNRPVRRIEVAFGAGLLGGASASDRDATLRGPDDRGYTLFTTDSRFATSALVEARAAFTFTQKYGVEVRFGFSRPELQSDVSADAEGAPAITVAERVDQYLVDGAFVMMLDRFRVGPLIPFATAGAGYLRQLHEGRTLVEEGTVYHVGGGVKHWMFTRQRGLLKAAGVRADARLYLLSDGIDLGEGVRPHAAVTGSLFVTF